MANYGTKEYWVDVRNRSALVLDSLKRTSSTVNATYKQVYDFCKAFEYNYDEYINAVEHLRELEATNECKSDA